MLTSAFCTLALRQFVATQDCWAQLHISDPGEDGLNGGAIDVRRNKIAWGPVQGLAVSSTNTLTWDNFQGIPSFPQEMKFVTLWNAPTGGICWATTPIVPIRVPHGAVLEIPPGITLHLATLTDD